MESAAHSASMSVTPRTTQRCVADHSMMRSIMSVRLLVVFAGTVGFVLRRAGLTTVAEVPAAGGAQPALRVDQEDARGHHVLTDLQPVEDFHSSREAGAD